MIFLRLEDGVDVVEESIFGIFDLLGSACDSKCASAIVYWQMLRAEIVYGLKLWMCLIVLCCEVRMFLMMISESHGALKFIHVLSMRLSILRDFEKE